eukprot:14194799-Alexandrium_andersonii.AAC.1
MADKRPRPPQGDTCSAQGDTRRRGACCPRPVRTACCRRCAVHTQWVATRAAPTRGECRTGRGSQGAVSNCSGRRQG